MVEDERLVVLSFDEMKVAEAHEYNVKYDQVIGLHSQMQVVNARGLFSQWKQPIYVDFDTCMTPQISYHIINKLHQIVFRVVACVSDCGGGNIGLLRDLGVTYENSFIKHPISGTNIYFFADAPHLLKLTRNWFLDSGFTLNNKSINK